MKRISCDGLQDHPFGCSICHGWFDSGDYVFGETVRQHLRRLLLNTPDWLEYRGAVRALELFWPRDSSFERSDR